MYIEGSCNARLIYHNSARQNYSANWIIFNFKFSGNNIIQQSEFYVNFQFSGPYFL